MRGFITGKEVLRNGPTIVRHYGPRCYLRCLAAVLLRKRTTFLEVALCPHATKATRPSA